MSPTAGQVATSVTKRAFDLTATTVALVLLAPVVAVAAAAVALTMGRPLLYRDPRAGRDGVPFELLKFRTMRPLGPGETIPEHDTIRVTPVGRFLRASSIDELPSLLNVLRGDMSLVGPRPLPVRYTERYSTHQRRRLEVRPGLTGLAQASGRNELSWEERFDLDVVYVDDHSLWGDLAIIGRTVTPVLRRSGIAPEASGAMPEFTGTPDADRADPPGEP